MDGGVGLSSEPLERSTFVTFQAIPDQADAYVKEMDIPDTLEKRKKTDNSQHKAICVTPSAPGKTKNIDNHISYPSRRVQIPVSGGNTEAEPRSSITYLFWHAKHFQHFYYVYNLARDCENRVEKLKQSKDQTNRMPKDVIIKIGIVGNFTTDNVKLISRKSGKSKVSEDEYIWKALPLVCFLNDIYQNSLSMKNVMRQEKACHKILIKSDIFCNKTHEADDSIISIGQDKDQIEEIIISCIEEPLHHILQKWSEDVKLEHFRSNTSDVIAEIEAISKKLVSNNSIDTEVNPNIPSTSTETIVPGNVKDYLFGRSDVNSFGLWSNSSFKVFVKKATNEKELKDELITLNKNFFKNYQLEIETKKWTEMQTLKQGDSIHSKNEATGTLGGFVTKTNNEQRVYALTCNHLFPIENEPAYTHDLKEIGACLYTTRDKGCDFAAIEIKECYLKFCDVAFRRDDKKKINANVYSDSLGNCNIVHKIGATTGVTNGRIVSPEFYLRVTDESTRENVFLVKGTAEKFSEMGDSGSLVFSRPNRTLQNYVDIIGMVYANDLVLYENDDKDDEDEDKNKMKSKFLEGSREEGAYNNEANSRKEASSSECENPNKDNNIASGINQETNGISFCCRIHTALKLFEENQGDDFEVKFKNDLSSPSPLSSSSSESED